MELKDMRKKTDDELREELLKLRREQFNLRMQRATGQLSRPDQFTTARRNIARIKTLLAERAAGDPRSSGTRTRSAS